MAFHEVLFPLDISYGSRGGPGFNTSIIQIDSGAEERVARWINARRRYDVAYGLKDPETQLPELLKFYIARNGVAIGFRFRDFADFASTPSGLTVISGSFQMVNPETVSDTDQDIGVGDGSTTQFQLKKKYSSGLFSRVRPITKPVAGLTVAALDAIPTTAFTVDTTTGIITFDSAPALDVVITAGFVFDVPVRFGKELDEAIFMSRDSFGTGSAGSIPLIEIRDELESDEEFFFGGSVEFNLTGNVSITISTGRVINIASATAGNKIFLPDFTNLAEGGPYFYISNNDGVDSVLIRDSADNPVTTIAAGGQAIILLGLVSAVKTWFTI